MSIHKISIHAILFRNGATKKSIKAKKRKFEKDNALPSLKDLTRNRSKKAKQASKKSLSWIFAKKDKGDY